MKTIKYAVAAIALSTLSFGAFAAEPVSASQTLKKPPLLAQALITSPPP